ncbi:MAG TPA: hypothetical protein PKD37_00635 [Oligoflexia bacterium]|nr:hypothetical protein [Oligoflexia bacterium]HMP26487.1 hypothetical protein [Oligoflexia bacterium]
MKRKIGKKVANNTNRKGLLRKGDPVMVIAGGSSKKRELKGKKSTITAIVGKRGERALLDGLNVGTKHLKQTAPGKPKGKTPKEIPVHISNLMYFADKLNAPVKLKSQRLADGTRVRGYKDPTNGEFVQISDKR